MHDLRMLRDQIDVLREGLRRRGALETFAPVLRRAEGLEQQRRSLIVAADERKAARNSNVAVSAQNMSWEREGAFTGEISAGMIKETGAQYAIIGHS